MSLRAPVVALRRVRRGDAVGYAALYRARADTRIATLALGYADGVPISASGHGSVWLAGARRPIAGRVSMDYVGVEVGDAAVEIGDPAIVFQETAGGPACCRWKRPRVRGHDLLRAARARRRACAASWFDGRPPR
jgi:alanine racemase